MSAHPDALVSGNAVNSQQTVGRAESAPVADRPGDAAAAVVGGDSNVTEARSTAAAPDTRSRDDLASEAQAAADQLSLGRRLRQPRTIVSIVLPLFLLLLMVRVALNIDVGELAQGIRQANPLLLAAAFAIFYIGFPLRGLRWSMLLRGVNVRLSVRHSTEMIFLSWLVNCLVPAKLGDVYRGYLLKINRPEVFLSLTLGTIFMERILDLFAIAVLGMKDPESEKASLVVAIGPQAPKGLSANDLLKELAPRIDG
ncbi:MAG: lysylphosphatidylglycerol synthase transmembrane domain-containing protein, partial [Chloroflexota bacterium]